MTTDGQSQSEGERPAGAGGEPAGAADRRVARLESIIDHGPMVAFRWSVGAGHPVDFVSANIAQFGYSPADFTTGRVAWLDIVDPDDRPRLPSEIERSFAEGDPDFRLSYRIHTASGEARWVEEYSQITRDAGGRPTHVEGLLWDVTQRRQAEQDLLASEAKYRRLAEDINDVVYSLDVEGRITYISPRVGRYGIAPEDVVGRRLGELPLVEDARHLVEDFERTMTSGAEFPTQFRLRDAQGAMHWVEEHGRVLRDEAGRATGIAGVLRDITDRKRLQEQRDWLDRQRRLALDAACLGWWHTDPATGATQWDRRFREIFGFADSRRDDARQAVFDRIHPEDRGPVWEAAAAAMDPTDPKPYSAEYRVMLPDGSLRWVEAHGFASFEGEGDDRRATDLVGTVQDITERKRIEQEARRYEDRLRSMALQLCLAEEGERKRLAAVLHDDVAQLLAAIKLKLPVLGEMDDPETRRQRVTELNELLKRAIRSTRSLTSQLSHPALYELGLASAIHWLANDIREIHGLAVTVESPSGKDPIGQQLRVLLFQCIRELLVNVAKHSGTDKAVVSLAWGQGKVRAVVEDGGRGFDPAAIALEPGAAGFGLFSIRERLGSLGGRMDVHSAPGEGTTIALTVPMWADPSAKPEDGGGESL
jgi:PAS domain S-box-containing protein